MLLYWPKKYIDNWFSKRYFQIKKDKVVVSIPSGGSATIGPHVPLHLVDQDELLKTISLRLPNSKLIPTISNLLVKVKKNEEDEEIILSLINYTYLKKSEEETLRYVELIIQLIEIIDEEEKTGDIEEEELKIIIEELNKLNLIGE